MDQAGVSLGSAYKALGLTPGASVSEIKAAYRRLALKCHPDLSPDNHGEFQRLSAAYQRIVHRAPNEELHIDRAHFASGGGGGGEAARSFGFRHANRPEQVPVYRTIFARPMTLGIIAVVCFTTFGSAVVLFSINRQDRRRIGVFSREKSPQPWEKLAP